MTLTDLCNHYALTNAEREQVFWFLLTIWLRERVREVKGIKEGEQE